VAVVRAAFNEAVVEGLARGACEALLHAGAKATDVEEIVVPGALELPLAAQSAARSGRFDAVVALGAVIRGETDHYEHVARACTDGLLRSSLDTGVPVGFGVLTVSDEAHAVARAAPGEGNKGAEAARAAVAMVHLLRGLRRGRRDTEPPKPEARRAKSKRQRGPRRERRGRSA
jgi:6,7-dimethyl-8-ribityllumazine synthase